MMSAGWKDLPPEEGRRLQENTRAIRKPTKFECIGIGSPENCPRSVGNQRMARNEIQLRPARELFRGLPERAWQQHVIGIDETKDISGS